MPLEAGFGAILGSFLTPPEPRKSCSRCGAVPIFAKITNGTREPKIDPKMVPKWSPKPPPEASKRLKLSIQDGASFLSKFQLKFERFWDPKMAPKITQKSTLAPIGSLLAASGASRASRRPPESDFRARNARKMRGLAASSPKKHGFGASKPS